MDNEQLIADLNLEYQKQDKCRTNILLIIIIILSIISIIFIILYATKGRENEHKDSKYIPLSLWNNCDAKSKLMNYIGQITNKTNKNYYIPKEDRIAVFDLDGTLFQETDPTYNDWKVYLYRVFDDPEYKNKATSEEKELGERIKKAVETNNFPPELDELFGYYSALVFANMTLKEFNNYTKNYLNMPTDGYYNLKRGDAFFKPMLEVIDYLQRNSFSVYIVSGTDRFQVRVIIEDHINIPKGNVIGSDYRVTASLQGKADGLDYIYTKKDSIQLKGEFIIKNLQMNKVQSIVREIGKQPVLSFGNSSGDSSMANYVINNNKYLSLAFMLLCDDIKRENGNKKKAEEMKNSCNKNNWIPISMEKDWKTIYGVEVTRKNYALNL